MLLSVFLGSGVQVLAMSFITLFFACLGFLSPANRGALMTCAIVIYAHLGTPAGYVSARLYKSFHGCNWRMNVLLTATLCPGIVFSVFFLLNLILWVNGSSAAVPFTTLIALLFLWFGISLPLTFVGAYFGFKKRIIEDPVGFDLGSIGVSFLLFLVLTDVSFCPPRYAPTRSRDKYQPSRSTLSRCLAS